MKLIQYSIAILILCALCAFALLCVVLPVFSLLLLLSVIAIFPSQLLADGRLPLLASHLSISII